MNVEYLLQLLGNRLNALNISKEQAFLTGDLERINTIDIEINGVTDTINKLKLLEGISQTALVTPFTEAQVVQNGIEASFGVNSSQIVFSGDPKAVLLGYDISSYATDPLHEEKIADILNYIGDMNLPSDIDAYIDNEAIASPVTGAMIYNSALKYKVDIRLMMALMELDSRFGTAGVAIRTLNPGNIGNDDSGETRTYVSWEEGVDAVARWLDNHRVDMPMLLEEDIVLDKSENVEMPIETIIDDNVIIPTTTEEIIPKDEPVLIPEVFEDFNQDQTVSVVKKKNIKKVV